MLLDATATNPAAAAAVSLLVLIAIAVGIGFYFLPTIIAVRRHNSNALMIGVLNFFLGWTFLGWVVSLALAFSASCRLCAKQHF